LITARVGEFGDKALGAEFGEVVAKGSERVAFAGAAKRFEDGGCRFSRSLWDAFFGSTRAARLPLGNRDRPRPARPLRRTGYQGRSPWLVGYVLCKRVA
jgi:hypothetical protein